MSIPYYDCDHTLLDHLSERKAARYISEGNVTAVRTKAGRIVRLYRRATTRPYPSMAAAINALHAGPSQYTTRMTDGYGTVIAAPQYREHRNHPVVLQNGGKRDG